MLGFGEKLAIMALILGVVGLCIFWTSFAILEGQFCKKITVGLSWVWSIFYGVQAKSVETAEPSPAEPESKRHSQVSESTVRAENLKHHDLIRVDLKDCKGTFMCLACVHNFQMMTVVVVAAHATDADCDLRQCEITALHFCTSDTVILVGNYDSCHKPTCVVSEGYRRAAVMHRP